MSDNKVQPQHEYTTPDPDSINWWSWRPGIKPRNAILIGGPITLFALLLACVGIISLVLGIMDSFSAPLQFPGIVTDHTMNIIDGLPRLTIRLHAASFPTTISPVVPQVVSQSIHNGDHVLVDYSPRLHFLYALESAGHHYALPGSNAAGNPIGSVALLLLSLMLLPYPGLLALWGLRDLHLQYSGRDELCTMKAKVVGKRAMERTTGQGRRNRPGLTPRLSRSWYGVALDPVDANASQQVMTFSIGYERYRAVEEATLVQVTYSPNLHYVYRLEQV